jgi:hypothetical protein
MKTWTYHTPDFDACIKIVKDGRCAGLRIDWLRTIIKWEFIYVLKYQAE